MISYCDLIYDQQPRLRKTLRTNLAVVLTSKGVGVVKPQDIIQHIQDFALPPPMFKKNLPNVKKGGEAGVKGVLNNVKKKLHDL